MCDGGGGGGGGGSFGGGGGGGGFGGGGFGGMGGNIGGMGGSGGSLSGPFDFSNTSANYRARTEQNTAETIADTLNALARRKRRGKRNMRTQLAGGMTGLNIPAPSASVNIPS